MSADPEAEYYQAVEEYYVSRRGDPLFLSNSEWNLVRSWRLAGLPLREELATYVCKRSNLPLGAA